MLFRSIRSTNNGVSCVIDECGVIRAELQPFTEAALTFEMPVPIQAGQTFYVRHGDVFVGVCAVLVVLWFAAVRAFRLDSAT